MNSRPQAIVIGLNPNALGTIRSLAAANVPITAIDVSPAGPDDIHLWMSSRTTLCEKVLLPPRAGMDEFIQALIHLGDWLPQGGCLFPSADNAVLAIAANRARLQPKYRFQVPEQRVLNLFANKALTYDFAAQHSVPMPRTLIGLSPDQLLARLPDDFFPCVIKPPFRDQLWDTTFPNQKAFIVHDSGELDRQYRAVHEKYPDLMVQEMIRGSDQHLGFSHVYIDRNGRELALWTGHKVRQLPIHLGTSTAARTVWYPDIAEMTRRLLHATDYRGYASAEFKFDTRDRQFKLLELTFARTWYPHFLGTASGMNIPALWYADLAGESPQPITGFREGVLWVDEFRDLVAAYDYWQAGELTVGEWFHSFRGEVHPALFSFSDPLPAAFVAARIGLSALRAGARLLGLRR